MKKHLLIAAAVALASAATWAVPAMLSDDEDVTITVNADNGTLIREDGKTSDWKNVWQSNSTDPQVVVRSDNNNIAWSGDNLDVRNGLTKSSTYTISTPTSGWYVKGYSFTYTGESDGAETFTIGDVDYVATTTPQTLSVVNDGYAAMTFLYTGSNSQVILTDFTITLAKKPVDPNQPETVDYELTDLGQASGDRYINSLALSDDAGSEAVNIGPARPTSGRSNVYNDLSDQSFTTKPGATVTVKVNGSGSWMHTYAYVDWGKDGFIYSEPADYVDVTTGIPLPGSDLVYYNCYNFGTNNGGEIFKNSNGESLNFAGLGVAVTFSFEIPANTPDGEYRMRVKSDWSSLDPAGNHATDNFISNNCGTVVDFTLKVKADIVETIEELVYNTEGTWSITDFCCEETAGDPGAISHLIDDNASTFYHSNWAGTTHTGLHFFVVDLGESHTISGLAFTPRQNAGSNNGRWQGYEVFASETPYDFGGVEAGQAWYTEHQGQGQTGTLSATAGSPAETSMFAEPIEGRYVLVVITASQGGFSCAAELGFYFQIGLTAADVEARKVAEIQGKLDDVKALAALYVKNAPAAAETLNALIESLDEYPAEMMLDYYDVIDEFIAQAMVAPLEEAVVDALNGQIGTQVSLYQHGQDALLSAVTKSTNKGWDSFNYVATLMPSTAWTLEAATGSEFYLKSAEGQYIATPIQGYCKVVDTQADANTFTFGTADGYVLVKSTAIEGAGLGFDGQNDPVEIMSLTDGSHGYEWMVTAYAPLNEENPQYLFFRNKRGNDYLSDHAEAINGTYQSSALYRQDQGSIESLWLVTPGFREGTVRMKNYSTGRYAFNLIKNGDTTSEDPIDIYLMPTSDGGVSISLDGGNGQTSMDADNHDKLVGAWTPATDGTTWYTEVLDTTKGSTIEEAVAYYFGLGVHVKNAIATLEAYRNVLPGASALVDEAIEKVNAITDATTGEAEIAAVLAGFTEDLDNLLTEIAENGDMITITNTRRASRSQAPLLAAVTGTAAEGEEAPVTINTVASATVPALWCIDRDENGGVSFYNVSNGMYIGNGDSTPTFVETPEEATVYTVTFRDNGTMNFTVNGTLMNIDTNGSALTSWSDANDAGSQWVFSACPTDETMFGDDEYPVKWVDVISGAPNYSDDSNGNALTKFTITFPAAAQTTGLGAIYVMSLYGEDVTAVIDPSDLAYDEATHTFTGTFDEPITGFDFFIIYVTPAAFSLTAEDGSITYAPELWSNYCYCFYAPNQPAELHVTPEESDTPLASLDVITMWMDGDYFDVNTYCTEKLVLSKNFSPIIEMTADEVYDLWNEATGFFDLPVNTSDEGTYTLTVPANMFYGSEGRSTEVNLMWEVDATVGITNVTINGEAAPQKVYDILGRRHAAPVKGFNIVDGVKTIIRK